MTRTVLLLSLCFAASAAYGEDLPRIGPALEPPPEMLRSFLLKLADEQLAKRREVIATLKTPQDIEQRQAYVRSTILKLMGGLPDQRGPLNLRRTGTLDRGDYRIEKIIFESLPNFFVTGNLYIPNRGSSPYPALVQPVGHSQNGKAAGLYQSLSVGLARNGFVVLTYDPIGQGERTIFFNADIRNSLVGTSTREHQMIGIQTLLAGQSVARYRVWDGMRAIDVLESLPEVDKERIGVAGCSGGGTLTTYLLALDKRVKAAAPACYISAWEEQLKGAGPQDAEQQFPDQLQAGINHGDFLIAFAPKPLLICSTTDDFFPLEGSTRTLVEMRRIYESLGAGEKISRFVGPGGHGMRRDTREAIYAWMNRWLRDQPPQPVVEPEHTLQQDEDLYATPTGQVANSLKGETASTWTMKAFAGIRPTRPVTALGDSISKLTRYQKTTGPLNIRSQSKVQGDGYEIEYLVYDSESGRYTPALLCMPSSDRAKRQSVLYLDQGGKAMAFAEKGEARKLCASGYAVLALDLAGAGETTTEKGGYSPEWFGDDNLTWTVLMVGRTMVGLRMNDIVRGIDVLAERGILHGGSAAGVANGTAGVSLLHAAAVESRLTRLVLQDPLVSWRAIAETPIHRRVFDSIVPGSLGVYDLQDLVSAIAPRPVAMVSVRSPLGDVLLTSEARKHYEAALSAHAVFSINGTGFDIPKFLESAPR